MPSSDQPLAALGKLSPANTVIIGIGNTLKGDDAAGPTVCNGLRRVGVPAEIIDAGTVPENYIQKVVDKRPRKVIIIDATDFAAPPGTIRLFEPDQLATRSFSTHMANPGLFIDLITRQTSATVYFVGIQPAQTKLNTPLSDEIAAACTTTVRLITAAFGST